MNLPQCRPAVQAVFLLLNPCHGHVVTCTADFSLQCVNSAALSIQLKLQVPQSIQLSAPQACA